MPYKNRENRLKHQKEYYSIHKSERAEYARKWRKSNKIKYSETRKAYRKNNPKFDKETQLKRNYGISIEQYNEIFNKQNGCCAICDKHQSEFTKALFVDHDHETGNVRGLLCSKCNTALGLMYDSYSLLMSAADYLERSPNVRQ